MGVVTQKIDDLERAAFNLTFSSEYQEALKDKTPMGNEKSWKLALKILKEELPNTAGQIKQDALRRIKLIRLDTDMQYNSLIRQRIDEMIEWLEEIELNPQS